MTENKLLRKAYECIAANKDRIEDDPYRLQFHLMPPVGLLNDPNGLIQFNGTYHVFYQWNPFETAHGPKFWGHYTSVDLVHWNEEEPALLPVEWYEVNGCYSGSAVEHEGKLVLIYTGNVKDPETGRQAYQCLAVSENARDFMKLGPVLEVPEGFTAHFRDPKVWKRDGKWYMVIGAQTIEQEGAAVLFSSDDLHQWTKIGPIAGSNMKGLGDFGYMWECPDFFRLDGKDLLLVSPQGLREEECSYQNEFQSGYFIGEWEAGTDEFRHGEFIELDEGFDFYAPQTFEDEKGRRLMIGWMGMTDEEEPFQPTVRNGWVHALTMPRELSLVDGKLIQRPVVELEQLRKEELYHHDLQLVDGKAEILQLGSGVCEISADFSLTGESEVEWIFREGLTAVFSPADKKFTLKRTSVKHGLIEERCYQLEELKDMRVFLDTSSAEIFLNGGSTVFTTRYFPNPEEKGLRLSGGRGWVRIQAWQL